MRGALLMGLGASLAVITLLIPGNQLALALLAGLIIGFGWSLSKRRY